VAAANRVGHEISPLAASGGSDGIEFWGQSFVAAPSGEIIAKGLVDREEIVMADVEWDRVNEHRTHWPFLRDRRVDAYAGINQRMID
jgi:N-carbamoylputrescine amidase